MAIVNMGGDSALNVFEVPSDSIVGDRSKMGSRGPIDHYALAVGSEEELLEIRDRLVAVGASPGGVTQFGPGLRSVFFEIRIERSFGSCLSTFRHRQRISRVIPAPVPQSAGPVPLVARAGHPVMTRVAIEAADDMTFDEPHETARRSKRSL